MNNKLEFLTGLFYFLFMITCIIIGICGIIFGQDRVVVKLWGIFLIIAPTIDITRRFTAAWIAMQMEEDDDDDNQVD